MQLSPNPQTRTEAADAAPETARADAVSTPAVSAEPNAADAEKGAAAESPAPSPEPSAEPTPAVRRIMMTPRRMTAPAPQSVESLPTPEASESPAPAATPTPSASPTPSTSPTPSAAPVKTESIRITKEGNRDKLLVLLSGTEADMPDKTPDKIYEAVLVSSDAYGSEEKLSIRIIGSEVWYFSTVSGESTSFAAQCSPKELETLLAAVREDERPPASPSPSAQPSPTPAPTTTPDPYLGTPEPANQK